MVSSKVNNSIIAGVNHNEMDEIPKNSKEWLTKLKGTQMPERIPREHK
jgi:hypothetical protein